MNIQIKNISFDDFSEARKMVWNVFLEYESPDYTAEGVLAFKKVIESNEFLKMLEIYGAYEGENLIGVIATRNEGTHIALFFVEGKYHRNGIGRKLFEFVLKLNKEKYMTVNSSPYAVEVYRKFGFKDTDSEKNVDGIIFIPMKRIQS